MLYVHCWIVLFDPICFWYVVIPLLMTLPLLSLQSMSMMMKVVCFVAFSCCFVLVAFYSTSTGVQYVNTRHVI